MHSTPHTKRIPRKSVNSFLFVCFSQVQKLLSNFAVGLKNTPQPLLFVCKKHATTALLTCRKVRAGRPFLSFRLAAFTY